MSGVRGWLLVALCVLAMPAEAAVRAWLDRTSIALGETVTLNIEVQGVGASAPDFSALDADFERRGSSSSSQISLVNGQRSAVTLFAVSLYPRREGTLRIPALEVGSLRTPELELDVGPSPIDTGSGGDVFLEAALAASEVYVQQQVVYVLKLHYALSLWDGQLDAPTADGVQTHRLGDDLKYQVERGGRRYSVIERRFALVPERSGEVEIAAPRFEGTGLDRGGYGGLLGSGGIRLSARAEPLSLRVKPRPAGAAVPWLPALSMELSVQAGAVPDEVRVGEPISLAVQISARGLLPAQLPELELPAIEGAAVYPDQATTRDRSTADGLAAERSRRFAVVPQRPGTLQLPAIRLPWWDVEADRQRWAEIPSRSVRVLPAAGMPDAPDVAAQPTAPGEAEAGPSTSPGEPASGLLSLGDAWPWALLSLLLGVGWLHALTRARASAAHMPPSKDDAPADVAPTLASALRGGDPRRIAEALRALGPNGPIGSLPALSAALADPGQQAAVRALQEHLYGQRESGRGEAPLEMLRRAFSVPVRWRAMADSNAASAGYSRLYR